MGRAHSPPQQQQQQQQQQQPLQLQPPSFFGCRRGLVVVCVMLALLLLLSCRMIPPVRMYLPHSSRDRVRCKPSPYSSAACGSFVTTRGCLHQILVLLRAHVLLRAASGGPGLFPRSKSKATRTDEPRDTPFSLFVWPSGRRKTYFNQVKPQRHETDGGSHSATRYRRSSQKKRVSLALRAIGKAIALAGGGTCRFGFAHKLSLA